MEPMIGFFILLIIAVPVVLLIVFIAKTNALASRVHWLEQELLRLRATLAAPMTPKRPEVTSTTLPVVGQKFTPPAPAPLIPPLPVAPPMRVPSPPPELHVEEKPSRAREEWEAFVGGKLLNRIGALALIIGVGFFLKYAFDNNWITESMRVLLGGVVGVALLLLGLLASDPVAEIRVRQFLERLPAPTIRRRESVVVHKRVEPVALAVPDVPHERALMEQFAVLLEVAVAQPVVDRLASEADLRRTEESGCVEGAEPGMVSKRARERGRPQLGSLGAGNHFIEIDRVEQVFDASAAAEDFAAPRPARRSQTGLTPKRTGRI